VKHCWVTDRGLWLDSGERTLALHSALEAAGLEEVEALVPGDGNLLVVLKPGLAPGKALRHMLKSEPSEPATEIAYQRHDIPVIYGGEAGPDLEKVAEAAGLPARQAIELHAGVEYQVAFLGFLPGFAYLNGTPLELQMDRRATPRTRVPGGSLAIGGKYTGIYPGVSPGGWHLIGRTEEWLFDLRRTPPARFAPGDRVRFLPK